MTDVPLHLLLPPGVPLPTGVLPVLLAPVVPPWLGAFRLTGGARVADVTMSPDTGALPGGHVLQSLVNGIGGWALALALVGLVVGAAAWALGSHGQNYQQAYVGRRAVLVSGLAALLIGAGPALVNFFFHAGQGVR